MPVKKNTKVEPFDQPLTLNIKEAVRVSGLPEKVLRNAIRNDDAYPRLRAFIAGRKSYRVLHEDLVQFVKDCANMPFEPLARRGRAA